VRGLFINFLAFLAINFCGAAIFYLLEDGWAYDDAFYHCIMTATTIGLGDIAPQTQGGRMYGVFQMIFSVALLGSLIGTILDGLDRRKQAHLKSIMLSKQVDADLIASLDKDDNGVDKTEFVLGMLQILGVLNEEDYAPFLEQFAKLDRSGDGLLTKDDLLELVELNKQSAQMEEKDKAALARGYATRIRILASELCAPSLIACFGFAGNQVFGFVLLGGGIFHGVAIGLILGKPLMTKVGYLQTALVTTIGALFFVLANILIIYMMVDIHGYMNLDSLVKSQAFAHLVDGLTISIIPRGYEEPHEEPQGNSSDKKYIDTLSSLFIIGFTYAIYVDIKVVYCCLKAATLEAVEVDASCGAAQSSTTAAMGASDPLDSASDPLDTAVSRTSCSVGREASAPALLNAAVEIRT